MLDDCEQGPTREGPGRLRLLEALKLTEEQINDLMSVINEEGDQLGGDRRWARDNKDVVQPLIDAAGNTQEA